MSPVKAMVFPVVMYGCESWTVKKAECWRIDAFELWCWRRFLRVPWTARRSNQSFLKEISPGCSLEGLMLKLKLQYFGHLMWRVDSLKKTLMLRGIVGRWRRGRQRMRWLDASPTRWTWVWVNSGSWWWTGRPGVLWFMGSQRVRHKWATELNWSNHCCCVPSLLAPETNSKSLVWHHPSSRPVGHLVVTLLSSFHLGRAKDSFKQGLAHSIGIGLHFQPIEPQPTLFSEAIWHV